MKPTITALCGHLTSAFDAEESELCNDCQEDGSHCEHCGKPLREGEYLPIKCYYQCECRS